MVDEVGGILEGLGTRDDWASWKCFGEWRWYVGEVKFWTSVGLILPSAEFTCYCGAV